MCPMSGVFAHTFAAVMALTVFLFPSPRDLVARLEQLVVSKQVVADFPNLNTFGLDDRKIAFLGEHTQTTKNYTNKGLPRAWARNCAIPVDPEGGKPKTVTPASTRAVANLPPEEKLAGRLLCQALWADAVASRRQFDADACLPA